MWKILQINLYFFLFHLIQNLHTKDKQLPNFRWLKKPLIRIGADSGAEVDRTMMVVFPNGEKDIMLLQSHNPMPDVETHKLNGSCMFLGTLKKDTSASVAVTGCPEDKEVEITLMSENLEDLENNQFILREKGVELIPAPWSLRLKTKSSFRYANKTTVNIGGEIWEQHDDELENSKIESDAIKAAQNCNDPKIGCAIPKLHRLQMKLNYDRTLAQKESNPVSWLAKVMTHVNAHYAHYSLGTRIYIQVLGTPRYYSSESWKAEYSLQRVRTFVVSDTSTDLHAFFCHDHNYYSGAAGMAYIGTLCNSMGQGLHSSVNEWGQTVASTAKIVAHEIGHNVGMNHDFSHYGKGCTGIMDYGNTPNSWSACSRSDFNAHYYSIIKKFGKHCMDVYPDTTTTTTTKKPTTTTTKKPTTTTRITTTTTPRPTITTATTTTVNPGDKICKISQRGDGYCDDGNNHANCNFDGGDCCHNSRENWNKYCQICRCMDPIEACKLWGGDKYCDDINNHAGCNWDGGDCCLNKNPGWRRFCTVCRCEDTKYKK